MSRDSDVGTSPRTDVTVGDSGRPLSDSDWGTLSDLGL